MLRGQLQPSCIFFPAQPRKLLQCVSGRRKSPVFSTGMLLRKAASRIDRSQCNRWLETRESQEPANSASVALLKPPVSSPIVIKRFVAFLERGCQLWRCLAGYRVAVLSLPSYAEDVSDVGPCSCLVCVHLCCPATVQSKGRISRCCDSACSLRFLWRKYTAATPRLEELKNVTRQIST
jgi:hypothetical protein